MTAHNDVIAVLTYDEMERDLDGLGRGLFSDGERQVDADTSSGRLRRGFREAFDARMARLEDSSRRFAIPLLPVHTGRPVAEQVRELIGRHLRPRRN